MHCGNLTESESLLAPGTILTLPNLKPPNATVAESPLGLGSPDSGTVTAQADSESVWHRLTDGLRLRAARRRPTGLPALTARHRKFASLSPEPRRLSVLNRSDRRRTHGPPMIRG
eukprot:486682-Hanusia_phi.AAC.1